MINKFNKYELISESAARLPDSEDYWLRKGKKGKYVALYTHDDLDGIFCGILMKKYLITHGFSIVKYGILNYTEGWKLTTVEPTLINVALDFASMPGDKRDAYIDFYLDHHGDFTDAEKEKYKNQSVQKLHTGSAYEALCKVLGVPQDELTVHVIDMVDAAKYTEYGISWQRLLNFSLVDIKKSKKIRLEFAAAFNQFIKRSDTSTLIEVIDSCSDASIYSIFLAMKKLYPGNNPYPKKQDGSLKQFKNELTNKWETPTKPYKDFIEDRTKTLDIMNRRTSGVETIKKQYMSFREFMEDFGTDNNLKIKQLDSYKIIGNLAFIPPGTWANALRARVIIERDFNKGRLKKEPTFILLQYGNTLQVCSYKKMETYDNLPVLVGGYKVDDLGDYMNRLLKNFQKPSKIEDGKIKGGLDYYDQKTTLGQDEVTVSGGHKGIGSISNIIKICELAPYKGVKYLDMFKNKIINDLSGIKFPIGISWGEPTEYKKPNNTEDKFDKNVRNIEDIRTINSKGDIVKKFKK